MNSVTVDGRFTQNWLQALTDSVGFPAARQVKPLVSSVDICSQQNSAEDWATASERLWQFGQANHLEPLLKLLPVEAMEWNFDDELFTYQLSESAAEVLQIKSLDDWRRNLGIAECRVPLTASAVSSEWSHAVRTEAVRQRQTVKNAAVPSGHTVQLGCQAFWKAGEWKVRFDDAPWFEREYPHSFSASRPSIETIIQTTGRALEGAGLIASLSPARTIGGPSAWVQAYPPLLPLHAAVLSSPAGPKGKVLPQVWSAVWPVIYREQNRLDCPIDLPALRRSLAECFEMAPQLTLSLFVLAKLVCMHAIGRGLGVLGDWK